MIGDRRTDGLVFGVAVFLVLSWSDAVSRERVAHVLRASFPSCTRFVTLRVRHQAVVVRALFELSFKMCTIETADAIRNVADARRDSGNGCWDVCIMLDMIVYTIRGPRPVRIQVNEFFVLVVGSMLSACRTTCMNDCVW